MTRTSSGLRLHDHPDSTNALKVRFLLAEMGTPCEIVPTRMGSEGATDAESPSPFNLVPVLVDGDFTLSESNTILRYLAGREGRDDLYPRDLRARARVDEIMDALSLQVRSALWPVEDATKLGPVPEGLLNELRHALDGFERLLADNGTCTGAFSIADCAATGRLVHLPELPVEPARWPKVARMLKANMARPAFGAANSA